jgi:hypothetical protein
MKSGGQWLVVGGQFEHARKKATAEAVAFVSNTL